MTKHESRMFHLALTLDGSPGFRDFAEARLLHAMAAYEYLSAGSREIVDGILAARVLQADADRADAMIHGTKAYDRVKRTRARDRKALA